MRDSDVAIGGIVLLGIVGALIYFLFPKFISGVLRGPSYVTIIKNQQNEIATFDRETEVIISYLQYSWTMKAFRKLDAVILGGGYDDWVQKAKLERDTKAREAMAYIERQRPALETLSQSLETRLSLREKTKRSVFDLSKSPLDSEIDALQADLDGKIYELTRFLDRFSKMRRSLNQKALTDWFQRSLLVGFLSAAIVVVVCGLSLAARNLSTTKPSYGIAKIATTRGFVATAPRQAGLITPIESPTLTDTAFHFTFQPKTGPIPESISSLLSCPGQTPP
jgi:hypothetical protein